MFEEECNETDCPVHFRVDVSDLTGSYHSNVHYRGEWCIFTSDNVYMMDALLSGVGLFPIMTVVVKVGDGVLGDLLGGPIVDNIFLFEMSKEEEAAQNRHDMVLYGLESGILSLEESVSPLDEIYKKSQQR